MRLLLLAFPVLFLVSCNTSSSKKDPNKVMDDTARMDHPPAITPTVAVTPVKISAADIPSIIKFRGKPEEAWKWTDKLGENILVTTRVAPFEDRDLEFNEEAQTAEIHAYHFVKMTNDYVQVWTMNDQEKSCAYDITCGFIPGALTITDLDKDGIAEIKLQYAMACRSDVSPATMKLILYENEDKYALRGTMWLAYSPELKYTVTEKDVNLESRPKLKDEMDELLRTFGRYESEKEFTNASPEFLTFARNEWLKYSKEKIGE